MIKSVYSHVLHLSSLTAPGDYDSVVNRVLSFSPSVSVIPVSIDINEDDIDEQVESFFADLTLVAEGDDDVQLRPNRAEIRIMSVGGKPFFNQLSSCN